MSSLNHKAVVPQKFEIGSRIKFRCYPGISCFTRCCRNIDILLTPYDVIRIKNRLGLSSIEFLQRYTRYQVDDKTTHPLLFLRLDEKNDRRCLFVDDEKGCTIYTDRPAACRYYPVGQATHRVMDEENKNPVHDEWYVIVKEDHCQGFNEPTEWTIGSWREDQDAALYDRQNREWKNILMKQDIPRDQVEEKRQKMFYMASYDLDSFRRYVFESRFLEIFDVDSTTVEQIKADDVELMHFAVKYLNYLFGISTGLDVKPYVKEDQIRRLAEMKAAEDKARAEREAEIRKRDNES